MVLIETAVTMLDALGTEMSALQHPDARTCEPTIPHHNTIPRDCL